jgi:DNA-binding ferritin-like protein
MNEALSTTLKALLTLAVQAHVAHWTAKSGYHHVVLGELYEFAHEAADRLAEPAIAALGIEVVPTGKAAVQLQATGKIDEELSAARAAVKSLQAEAELQEPWLANIAQEIEAALYVFQFKLKRLV